MQRHGVRLAGGALLAVALTLSLAGCSSSGLGGLGAFGEGPLQTADLPNVAAYDAGRALSEARAHFRLGDFGYSAALYKRYVDLTPNDPQGYVGLAASYDRLRRFDLSDRVYAALHRMTGDTAQYYNNLGYSCLLRGDTASALTNLRKANQLDPQNPTVANNLRMLANAMKRTRAS